MSVESVAGKFPWSVQREITQEKIPHVEGAASYVRSEALKIEAIEQAVRHGWTVADRLIARDGAIAAEFMNEDGNLVMIPGVTMKLTYADGRVLCTTICPREIITPAELIDVYDNFGQLLHGPSDTITAYRFPCPEGVVSRVPVPYELPKTGLLPGVAQGHIMGAQQRAAQI